VKLLRSCLIAIALAGVGAAPAMAHHSFAMFDREHATPISGTVKDFQWTNPHVWIEVMVAGPDGVQQEWGIECTSVNILRRQGWTSDSLKPGDKVKLEIFHLKDGSHGGQFHNLTELNGRTTALPGYQ
jgi:hypothetical protein